jgi:hypothetical protein
MVVGCPFITCAIKKVGVEFCWDCSTHESCEKWQNHRETGREHDSFKSYQKLEDDIAFIKANGVESWDKQMKVRESLLIDLLKEYNEGRSKSYYCIAATVMNINELRNAIKEADLLKLLTIKEKSRTMHAILDSIARKKGYCLRLRK